PRDIPYYELKNLLEKELEKDFLYFFKRNTFFLINPKKIEQKILKEYPEIKKANLKKKLPRTLILEIQLRKAAGVWCFSEDNCFLIDEKGIIYGEHFPVTLKKREKEDLITIFKITKEIKKPGENVISPEKMSQLLKIQNKLKNNLQIEIEKFTLKKSERLDVKTTEGWQVYFDLSGDINLALVKLNLILEKEIPPEERKNLQYIDLRFSKVYYK
ncbi:FtsQ-type POTRA domain-containing protein, partial [bacterium]|nr:FtsQ-type POTRA domain-containing protein [bacterium]